ncbi:MAG: UPF0175 family protein [Nitrospirota bacterium]
MLKGKEMIRTNVLLDREVLEAIDEFAKDMAEDRSTVIRKLIRRAISEEKIEAAVKKFRSGVPFRKAAELAALDYWDFQAELDKRGIPVSSSLLFAKKRIK